MASATALLNTYRKLKKTNEENITPKGVFELATREKDYYALEAFRKVGRALGIGLASLTNALDPDTVVLGGGLSNALEILWPLVRDEMKARLLARNLKRVKVVPAELGTFGGAIGAACLAVKG